MLESGLHYNWHRYYDPSTGRHTTPDPLGFVDGPSVYGYAGQSPLMWVDPDGRTAGGATIGGTIGGWAGGIAGEIINPAGGGAAGALIGRAVGAALGDALSDLAMAQHGKGNKADTGIAQDWEAERSAGATNEDRCKWLDDQAEAGRYSDDRIKATAKAWGCRPSRQTKDQCKK